MLFIIILVVAILVNFYIIVFGKKDLQALGQKISIKKYLSEINGSLVEIVGDKGTTIIKIVLVILAVAFVLVNTINFLIAAVAVVAGTYIAKKLHGIPCVSNALNKFATYINRLHRLR